ncbi:hypothetical protein POPTR_018G094050v4 [Populus trichocarpa]|uniref:Uncharacterized protein n=1 Tax=Populus trichocarpa TaxID=3694 RepID=A0ACC0RNF0_POPTR|nr:hypothetical protein BDE02_18G076600 [Populus trichocarpa]KAI9378442.1 hypothetical protein POPTR_018G094050v4 [Populus trichocarpa]
MKTTVMLMLGRRQWQSQLVSVLLLYFSFLLFSVYLLFFTMFLPPCFVLFPPASPAPLPGFCLWFSYDFSPVPVVFFFASPRFLLRFFLVSDSLFCCLWFWRLVAEDCEDDGQCQFSSLRFRSLVFFFF